jgi:hypothetical protein
MKQLMLMAELGNEVSECTVTAANALPRASLPDPWRRVEADLRAVCLTAMAGMRMPHRTIVIPVHFKTTGAFIPLIRKAGGRD